jgi:hypothetical protein
MQKSSLTGEDIVKLGNLGLVSLFSAKKLP